MGANLIIDNQAAETFNGVTESEKGQTIQDKLAQLELQLTIFKQAESIGEIGNWQINLNNFETWYSDNVFRIYGLQPFTVNSHPDTFNIFIHEKDREVVLNAFEKSYAEKIPLHLEFRIKRQDGQERHVNIVSSVTKNPKGEPLLTGITQDITDRKNLEIQLREYGEKIKLQNESFRQAEQIGLFGSWQINLSTRETHYSENYFRIFGLKPASLAPGLDEFIHYVHPNDKGIFKELVKKIFDEQEMRDTDFRIIRPDGKHRYLRFRGKNLKNAQGEIMIVGVVKDITTHTKLEKQLKEVNEQLQVQNLAFTQAEESTATGSWTWNLHTDQVNFSHHTYTLYGLKPQTETASLENFFPSIHPMDLPDFQRFIEALKQSPAEGECYYRIIRPDGNTRHLRTRVQPINSASGQTIIIGTTQDRTDDYLLNHQLKERIHFAEMLSENIIDKVCITNASNNIIGWNTRSEMALQLSKHEVLGRNIFEVLPKLKHPDVIAQFNKALNGELVQIPQITLPYLEGYHELTMVPIREETDEVKAVLILLHDVTEFQKLKSELEERVEFIEKLVESTVHRIMVLDRGMRFLYWNKKSGEHYGFKKEKVIGKHIMEIFPRVRNEEVYEKIRAAFRGETIHVPIDREAVSDRYSDAFLVPIKNVAKQTVAVLWIEHDLTDLINAEKEIQRQNQLWESVLNAPNVGVNVFKAIRDEKGELLDFEFVMVSQKGQELTGRTDLVGKNLLTEFPELSDVMDRFKYLLETGKSHNYEYNLQLGNRNHWLYCSNAKFGDGFINVWEDITDKIIAEQSLKRSNDLLQSVFDTSQTGIAVLESIRNEYGAIIDFEFKLVNASGERMLGRDLVGKRQVAEYGEGKAAGFFALNKQVVETGTPFDDELLYSYEGEPRWYRITAAKMGDGLVVGFDNITERKNGEQLILSNRALLMQAEEMANLGSWEWNVVTNIFTWSDQVFRIFDYSPQSFVPTLEFYLNIAVPEDQEFLRSLFEAAKTGEQFSIQHRSRTLDGRMLQVALNGQPIKDELGNINIIRGTLQDMTLTHDQDQELRMRSEEIRMQSQIERQSERMRHFGAWQWNLVSGEVTWGETMFILFGKEPYSFDPTVESFIDHAYPGDRHKLKAIFDEIILVPPDEQQTFEFRVSINNEIRNLRTSCKKLINSTGIVLVVGSTIDYTEDAHLHQVLAERVNFAEALIESSVDPIMAFDRDLRILAWNKKCEIAYGHKKEAVLGKYFLELFPKLVESDVVMTALRGSLDGNAVFIPVHKAIYTSGYVEGHFIPLKADGNEVYGILSITRDVTERIVSEKELRELNDSLSEKNRELQEMNEELNTRNPAND